MGASVFERRKVYDPIGEGRVARRGGELRGHAQFRPTGRRQPTSIHPSAGPQAATKNPGSQRACHGSDTGTAPRRPSLSPHKIARREKKACAVWGAFWSFFGGAEKEKEQVFLRREVENATPRAPSPSASPRFAPSLIPRYLPSLDVAPGGASTRDTSHEHNIRGSGTKAIAKKMPRQ